MYKTECWSRAKGLSQSKDAMSYEAASSLQLTASMLIDGLAMVSTYLKLWVLQLAAVWRPCSLRLLQVCSS